MQLEYTNIQEALEDFAKQVIKESKQNLKRLNKKASGDLQNKIRYDVKEMPNSISMSIGYPDNEGGKYAKFVNYGVKGTKSGKSLKNYKFTNKMPPRKFLKTWLKQKRGRFRERNLDNLAFLVQRSVYQKGIKPTEYYSKPFEKAFKTLPDELIEAYGLDVDDFLRFVFND